MKILVIDSSNKKFYCQLIEEGVLLENVVKQGIEHSRTLNVTVQEVLDKRQIKLKDIDVFALSVGTGSFTGIRIGIAAVKGFLTALPQKKALSVNSLQVLAYTTMEKNLCLMEAGRGFYYCACYQGLDEIIPPCLITGEEAQKLLAKGALLFEESADYSKQLFALVCDKVKAGEYAQKLTPIYLRQPQAVEQLNANDRKAFL